MKVGRGADLSRRGPELLKRSSFLSTLRELLSKGYKPQQSCGSVLRQLRCERRGEAWPVNLSRYGKVGNFRPELLLLFFFIFFNHISPVSISAYFINKAVSRKMEIVGVVGL